ncbi:d2694213-073f-48ff-b738-5d9b85163272 [Thermothielavioides terrestris]|uniref:D2694213-073f-48ff-b738-5d9b85163272 n=1 Tax=Thermothielavioides terrestris TaxID=2587410 RepID=A0A3S4ANK1_9PEZI|nr:d2694213-073f-48ff-b738-5d9b85163272 [Thermothielavioides terrestris]
MLWRALKTDTSRAWYVIRNTSFRDVMRTNPVEAFGAIVALLGAVAFLGYCVYIYYNYFYSRQFTRYPPPVAQALRKALYFSNHDPDPQRALKYYKQALELCDEAGLDHFSDDVMGIKIQVAAWLEKIESYHNAITVLENLLSDCKRWVEAMEKSAKEGTLPKVEPPPAPKEGEPAVSEQPRENFWAKRTRLLAKAIGISVKLANLYSDEHVLERELAHERLVWAVETSLRETQRRAKEGLKEGEGPWMSPEEIGGSLEALAHSYQEKSQYHLALPLFFQALRLCEDPCHMAILMNNIATSFAEHPLITPGDAPVHAMMEESKTWASPAEQRASYLAASQRWAQNAITHASEPQGEKRTPECDQACAVSLSNLGSVLAMLGRTGEARQKFEQAIALSKKLGFDDYAAEASARLQSLPTP